MGGTEPAIFWNSILNHKGERKTAYTENEIPMLIIE